jgi:hypothetical protein
MVVEVSRSIYSDYFPRAEIVATRPACALVCVLPMCQVGNNDVIEQVQRDSFRTICLLGNPASVDNKGECLMRLLCLFDSLVQKFKYCPFRMSISHSIQLYGNE